MRMFKQKIGSVYSTDFYDHTINRHGINAAEVVVPLIVEAIPIQSVVDIGCGEGAWLSIFKKYGMKKILGVDGGHILEARLLISSEDYYRADLSKPFVIPGYYDLAVCLELAEHLPKPMAPVLIENLTKLAPFILFSAAVPGQRGVGHIHERWPEYWKDLFKARGYERLDVVRKKILYDDRVPFWYRQNIYLYADQAQINKSLELKKKLEESEEFPFEILAPYILESLPSIARLMRRYLQRLCSKTTHYVKTFLPRLRRYLLKRLGLQTNGEML